MLVALLVGEGIQSALDPRGPQADRIAHLWWIFFWVCVAVYAIVAAFVIAAVIRGRMHAAPEDGPEVHRRLTFAVGTGAGATILILIVLLFASASTGAKVGTYGRGRNALEIEVTGHQWWWEIKYPNALVPSHGFVTANEIHIPVGTPVLLHLDTRDVIHSLWIPNLHGKRDLIPGRENKLWIEADRAGTYRGQCAEYCGGQHAHMGIVVIADPPEKFADWETRQQSGAIKPHNAAEEHGRQVFLSSPCANCHNIVGEEAYGSLGPDLTHIGSRTTLAAGTLINNRGNLGGWIVDPQAIKPGNQMPPNAVTSNDLQDLITYLESLR